MLELMPLWLMPLWLMPLCHDCALTSGLQATWTLEPVSQGIDSVTKKRQETRTRKGQSGQSEGWSVPEGILCRTHGRREYM